jgi:cyclophilin family peptidyl-prolyl cis-trans isomerase
MITTDYGIMILKLYNKTPLHRDNFIKLVKQHFFDSLLFHRVIKGFMIQGGDPESKHAKEGQFLGEGSLKYTLPAEFDTSLFHKKGALAAARESDADNPQKKKQFNTILYCGRNACY